jgi:anthranilate phosphoribosyltransferase
MEPSNTLELTRYVAILAKGRLGSRDLTQNEAKAVLLLILKDECRAEQVGAILTLMRIKDETPQELAGMVEAARTLFETGSEFESVDIDWPCYAGKRRHLPWHLLAAFCLATHGYRILMHGPSDVFGRLYVSSIWPRWGLPLAQDLTEARQLIRQHGICFWPTEKLSPKLSYLLALRQTLGVRSIIHSLMRVLNPLAAKTIFCGVFHPPYVQKTVDAMSLLGQKSLVVFKGEGGEPEVNPDAAIDVGYIRDYEASRIILPTHFTHRHVRPPVLNPDELFAFWRGDVSNEYGEAAITNTIALVLWGTGRIPDWPAAKIEASRLWDVRVIEHWMEKV